LRNADSAVSIGCSYLDLRYRGAIVVASLRFQLHGLRLLDFIDRNGASERRRSRMLSPAQQPRHLAVASRFASLRGPLRFNCRFDDDINWFLW